jgi:hypothetical protein
MNLPSILTWTHLKDSLNDSGKPALARFTVSEQNTLGFYPRQSAPPNPIPDERRQMGRPLPLPEVTEGKGSESEWALWEVLTHQQVEPTIHEPAVEYGTKKFQF